jgi:hypothetical protein
MIPHCLLASREKRAWDWLPRVVASVAGFGGRKRHSNDECWKNAVATDVERSRRDGACDNMPPPLTLSSCSSSSLEEKWLGVLLLLSPVSDGGTGPK